VITLPFSSICCKDAPDSTVGDGVVGDEMTCNGGNSSVGGVVILASAALKAGATVGLPDGYGDGRNVGLPVGYAVGKLVGDTLGITLGNRLGETLGMSVGFVDGVPVGLGVKRIVSFSEVQLPFDLNGKKTSICKFVKMISDPLSFLKRADFS
jgi:hypothetical protein